MKWNTQMQCNKINTGMNSNQYMSEINIFIVIFFCTYASANENNIFAHGGH